MSSNTGNIHPDLALIAVEKAEGFALERFAQDLKSFIRHPS